MHGLLSPCNSCVGSYRDSRQDKRIAGSANCRDRNSAAVHAGHQAPSEFVSAIWTAETSETPAACPGRRDHPSAFPCRFPGRDYTLKSNSASFSNQRATCPLASLKFVSHRSASWSILAMKRRPYKVMTEMLAVED